MATVTFHGVRGSCPCSDPRMRRYGGATACVSVQPDGDVPPIVLDLGTGSRLLGEELMERYYPGAGPSPGAPPEDMGADPVHVPHVRPTGVQLAMSIFITHLHFDHVQGFPFFGPVLREASSLEVYGPAQDLLSLHDAFNAFVQPPYFPVGLDALPAKVRLTELEDEATVNVGDAVVMARSIPHVGRTLGYRIETDGCAVAYLGDHQAPRSCHNGPRVSEAAMSLARDADVLVHDAQYTNEEFGVKEHWGHSTVDYAVEVALAARARKLVLFHHDPTHQDDMLDQLGHEAQRLAGDEVEVVVAAEGLTIKLGV